jgi:hypothetical protein
LNQIASGVLLALSLILFALNVIDFITNMIYLFNRVTIMIEPDHTVGWITPAVDASMKYQRVAEFLTVMKVGSYLSADSRTHEYGLSLAMTDPHR